jgi:hypothetical protein
MLIFNHILNIVIGSILISLETNICSLFFRYLTMLKSSPTVAPVLPTVRPPPKKTPFTGSEVFNGKYKMFPYQVQGVNWLALNYHQSRSCLLADEMVHPSLRLFFYILKSSLFSPQIRKYIIYCFKNLMTRGSARQRRWSCFFITSPPN